jgi:S1-C subfamily serine protease
VDIEGLDEAALSVVSTDLGAPWVDADGQVVGLLLGADVEVPDASRPPEEGFHVRPQVVAAYALPSEVLAILWPLLRDRQAVPRAAIGIRTRPLDEALSQHVCRDCSGWVVTEIATGSPAERAGLRVMDIVRGVDGLPLAPGAMLAEALLPLRPGDTVQLEVLREGRAVPVRVVLGESR